MSSTEQTQNDKLLLEEARQTNYWEWEKVYTSMEDADSDETKKALKNIVEILYDIYMERGYYDPTAEDIPPPKGGGLLGWLKCLSEIKRDD